MSYNLPEVIEPHTYMDLPQKRHPEFYFTDGMVTFLVSFVFISIYNFVLTEKKVPEEIQEMLYRLYPGLLTKHSVVFETMLSLPQSQQACQQDAEGHYDKNPIVLHGIVRQEFDLTDFLIWLVSF